MVEYFGDDEEKTPTNKKGGDLEKGFTMGELKSGMRLWDALTPEEKQAYIEFQAKTPFSLEEILEAGKAFEKDSHDS